MNKRITPERAKSLLPGMREARRVLGSLPMLAFHDVQDLMIKDLNKRIRKIAKIAKG